MTDAKTRPVKVPSREESLRILAESGCSDDVVAHCVAVADLASRIARRCGADPELVEAGALMHDLGRCRTHGIAHAVEGAKLATELKMPPALVKVIERHIGGGITKPEAKKLGLPAKDYTPETLEEKVVAHADNLFSGTERVTVRVTVNEMVRKGLDEQAAKVLRMHKDMSEACGCDVDDIR